MKQSPGVGGMEGGRAGKIDRDGTVIGKDRQLEDGVASSGNNQ